MLLRGEFKEDKLIESNLTGQEILFLGEKKSPEQQTAKKLENIQRIKNFGKESSPTKTETCAKEID